MSVEPRRSILFVTGTRADYGKMEPLARAAGEEGHEVSFFVTGMHMMRRYGETRIEVARFGGARIFEYINQAHGDSQESILAKTVVGFSDWTAEHRPDLVVVHGDRVEALAVSLVCAMRYIRCAHVEGGEVSGTIDELFRHCNTKLSRYHFVSSEEAARRVVALGEDPYDVFVIGSPELDVHGRPSGVSLGDVRARYDIEFDDFGIVVFHPVTSEQETIGAQARSLFDSLARSARRFVVIAPNNDPGSSQIFEVINSLPADRFKVLPSMRFAHFSELMRSASVIVGNSSIGVREAPFLGVPSLDVGTRQTRRGSAPSVHAARADDADAIGDFLRTEWGKRYRISTNFGSGTAAQSFVEVIGDPRFWSRSAQKHFYEEVAH